MSPPISFFFFDHLSDFQLHLCRFILTLVDVMSLLVRGRFRHSHAFSINDIYVAKMESVTNQFTQTNMWNKRAQQKVLMCDSCESSSYPILSLLEVIQCGCYCRKK